jgi:hypothetical protein
MPGACELSALHPKSVKRMRAFTSRFIVIPGRLLIDLLGMLLAGRSDDIHHCSWLNCDISELLIPYTSWISQ